MKICKNDDFRQIAGIFDREKIFHKDRTRLCAKNQKKLMMKSRENAQKPVFPAHFRHFRPEINFSGNRAPSHFGSLCQKSAKTNEQISRKASNERTDIRTDGQRLIYRTSKVGPKIISKYFKSQNVWFMNKILNNLCDGAEKRGKL